MSLDLGAARERVRVARALGTLPALAEAPARGELSYAKVRALTRIATPETEARLLDPGAPGERYRVGVHVDAAILGEPAKPGHSVLEEGAHVSARTTRRLALPHRDRSCIFMRAPGSPRGAGNGWTCAGRSTCCIRGRGDPRPESLRA